VVLAAAVLLPGAGAQELPEVVPDCPSQVAQASQAQAELVVTDDQRRFPNQFNTSHNLLGHGETGTLTPGGRFNLFLERTGSKANLSTVALGTSYSFEDRPYGTGVPGFSKLYAAKLADSASRNFFEVVVLSHALRQDPRRYRSTSSSTLTRFADAAGSVVVTRTDEGQKTFNSSRVLATFLSAALSNAYYPEDDRTFGRTMGRAGRRLMLDVSSGVVREFAPDLLRKLLGKRQKSEPPVEPPTN
jgi:hypothetical protein